MDPQVFMDGMGAQRYVRVLTAAAIFRQALQYYNTYAAQEGNPCPVRGIEEVLWPDEGPAGETVE